MDSIDWNARKGPHLLPVATETATAARQEPNRSESQIALLRRIWGQPYFESPGLALFTGDCLSLLKQVPQGLFDLTVTSPPYNIGKAYETIRPMHEYLAWCRVWMKEIHRTTSQNGAFWLNLGYVEMQGKGTAVPLAYMLWDQSDFHLLQEIVWNYGAGVACKQMFSPRNEKFLWFVKNPREFTFNLDAVRDPDVKYPNQKKNGKLRCNPLGKNPSDVWGLPKVTSGTNRSSKERTPHPAQFPVAVIDRIIKATSKPGDLILDPFMGSGTTAEVALQNDRQVVGIELNEQYLAYAVARIQNYKAQTVAGMQTVLF